MNEIALPENQCPLCDLENIKSVPFDYSRVRLYNCPNCGHFSITIMAYRFTPIINDKDIKAKLSYFVHYNTSEENPICIEKNNYENLLNSVTLPTTLKQLDNLLLWFGEKSKYSLDSVNGNTKHLIAFLGSKDFRQVIRLLDQLWEDGYIKMEIPTTGSPNKFLHFDVFRAHLTKTGIENIQGSNAEETNSKAKISNPPSESIIIQDESVNIESILLKKESLTFEVKGSCKLNIDRLLKDDNKKYYEDKIAIGGFLKEIVAFLNTAGGTIIIGALEVGKFTKEQISKIPFKLVGNYYVIGIQIENESVDKYQLLIHDLISSHISKELVELIEISFPELSDFTLCKIVIKKASHKCYYLDKDKFYVRIGNKTEILSGDDADLYKKRTLRL